MHLVNSIEEAEQVAGKMLGNTIYTVQCPVSQGGRPVREVLIEEVVEYQKELYFSILLDRSFDGPCIIGSQAGGVNIEEVALKTPKKILKIPVCQQWGLQKEDAIRMATFLGFHDDAEVHDFIEQCRMLYQFFADKDCTQIEINPMVQSSPSFQEKVYCLDAKVSFDDSTEYRHRDIFAYRDVSQEDPREVAAHKWELNYVGLEGEIGCLVNGAGLAMATMDIIKLYGSEPANFLDVGGNANEEQVREAFKIIIADPSVKGIFVNIFGGIMRCDTIALGIVNAAQDLELEKRGVPLVVRLSGTNSDKGKKILEDSGLLIDAADDMDEGAQKIVKAIAAAKAKLN